jgi:hypothetical protein
MYTSGTIVLGLGLWASESKWGVAWRKRAHLVSPGCPPVASYLELGRIGSLRACGTRGIRVQSEQIMIQGCFSSGKNHTLNLELVPSSGIPMCPLLHEAGRIVRRH